MDRQTKDKYVIIPRERLFISKDYDIFLDLQLGFKALILKERPSNNPSMRKQLHGFYFVSKGTIFDNGKYIKRKEYKNGLMKPKISKENSLRSNKKCIPIIRFHIVKSVWQTVSYHRRQGIVLDMQFYNFFPNQQKIYNKQNLSIFSSPKQGRGHNFIHKLEQEAVINSNSLHWTEKRYFTF